MTEKQIIKMYHRGHKIKYSPEYDAQFCADCDEWISPLCRDVECSLCVNRPAKPSDVVPELAPKTENTVLVTLANGESGHPCHVNRAISLIKSGRAIPVGITLRKHIYAEK